MKRLDILSMKKRTPFSASGNGTPTDSSENSGWTLPGYWRVVLIVFLMVIAVSGYFFTKHFFALAKAKEIATVQSVARFQMEHVRGWRVGLIKEMEFIAAGPLHDEVRAYLKNPSDKALKQELILTFNALLKSNRIRAVELMDAEGHSLLTAATPPFTPHLPNKEVLQEAMRRKAPVFSPLHFDSRGIAVVLELVGPLFVPVMGKEQFVAHLVLWLDPEKSLLLPLSEWPIPTRTGMSFIVKRDGDSVIFLNDPRHYRGMALKKRFPLSYRQMPAVMAVQGVEGIVEGIDFDGDTVLASLHHIPETDWYLVTKIDIKEIHREARQFTYAVAAGVVLLILLSISMVFLLWRHQRVLQLRALVHEERERAALIEATPNIIVILDRDECSVWLNKLGLEFFGEKAIGKKVWDYLVTDSDRQRCQEIFHDYFLGKREDVQLDIWVRRADGEERLIYWIGRVLQDEKGQRTGVLVVGTDITDRKRMEEALQESEAQYRTLVNESLVGVYLLQDRLFRFVNPKLAEIFGYTVEELVDKKDPLDLVFPQDRARVEENLRRRIAGDIASLNYTCHGLRKDGSIVELEVYGSRTMYNGAPAIQGTLLDISEQKNLQAQLVQAQKMESLGTLAGGIAHDFNNILTGILGFTEIALSKLKVDDPNQGHLLRVRSLGDRAVELTKNILLFSRKQKPNMQEVDLAKAVEEFVPFIRRMVEENIEIKSMVETKLPAVHADATQLHQILMNLCVNARDAMPHGGALTIELRSVHLGDEYARVNSSARPGRFAVISVTDTGIGMGPDIVKRIFDPFFTTKELGKGTGLGLSVCFAIVRDHDGWIDVYSEPDVGTTFRVYLPLRVAAAKSAAAVTVGEKPAEGAGELILVADDEVHLCELARSILEQFNYRVAHATDGGQALSLFEEHRSQIRLVMTDVVMPEMGGISLAKKVRALAPEIPILFCSGYSMEIVKGQLPADGNFAFLSKPYLPWQLARRVHELLHPVGAEG